MLIPSNWDGIVNPNRNKIMSIMDVFSLIVSGATKPRLVAIRQRSKRLKRSLKIMAGL